MIIDVTGVMLTPANNGKDCLGNGEHVDKQGNPIEICCDNCDYFLCCLETHTPDECKDCDDKNCPHSPRCKF